MRMIIGAQAVAVQQQYCVHAVVVPGLLEPLRELLRAYRQLLAGEQAAALAMIPAELQSPCDLAHNVYAADHYLAKGWPLFLREPDGRFSELVDFDAAFVADPALFSLPAGYTRSAVGGLPE